MLALLGEVTVAPRFTAIEIERGIVREEILEDLDDDGRDIDADNLSRALIYEQHPLGYTITGDIASLDRFDEALIRKHHERHYTGENAVLAVAGKIEDLDACLRTIERSFGAMPRGRKAPITPPGNGQKKARFQFVENSGSQTDLRVAFRAPCETDPREPAVEMLLRVLDDGMSTRLYERICDRLGLCYDVSGMFETYEDDGVVDIAAGVQHERATVVTKEIFSLLRELCDEARARRSSRRRAIATSGASRRCSTTPSRSRASTASRPSPTSPARRWTATRSWRASPPPTCAPRPRPCFAPIG